MKAWAKTQATFQEDNVEFTPNELFTFITYNDKKYLIPIGLTQYEATLDANTDALINSMICFSGNKYVIDVKEWIKKLRGKGFDVASQLLESLDLDDTISMQEQTELYQNIVKVGGEIPNEDQRRVLDSYYKVINPELEQVASITLKFMHHMIDAHMVEGLVDPSYAKKLIHDYGADPANDKVF